MNRGGEELPVYQNFLPWLQRSHLSASALTFIFDDDLLLRRDGGDELLLVTVAEKAIIGRCGKGGWAGLGFGCDGIAAGDRDHSRDYSRGQRGQIGRGRSAANQGEEDEPGNNGYEAAENRSSQGKLPKRPTNFVNFFTNSINSPLAKATPTRGITNSFYFGIPISKSLLSGQPGY
jgi:hypothetical protein